jgi:DNA replication protein DnaC
MRETLGNRIKEAMNDDLSYEDFLNLILFDEVQHRRNVRRQRLIKSAGFRSEASLEGLDYKTPRNFDKKLIKQLSTMRFVDDGVNLLIHGPTGVGKTYLATAIGNHLCRHGRSTLFVKMNLLFENIALVRVQGRYLNFLKKIRSIDLLIVDDFGLKPLTEQQFQDFYDVLDERDNGKATIVTTQLPSENWDEVIKDPIVCEAISDRIVSKAIKIKMTGPTGRGKKWKELTGQEKTEK